MIMRLPPKKKSKKKEINRPKTTKKGGRRDIYQEFNNFSKGPRSKKAKTVGVPGMIKKFLDGTKLKGSARDRLEFDLFMKQLEFGGKKRGGKVKKK